MQGGAEMKIKDTVRFGEINKWTVQFFAACLAYEHQYHDTLIDDELTLTSANDSIHPAPGSFHPLNKAWDLRANDKTTSQREQIIAFLRRELGYGWDAILETPKDPAKHHFHIERDTRNYPEA
jgi:hypothetical protein